jgi:[ribosomal protein S5]-alanine N-acetyltransferase
MSKLLYTKVGISNKIGAVTRIEKLGFTFDRALEGLTGVYADCNSERMYVMLAKHGKQ